MGDAAETFRPIWRTPLAAVLAAWMAMVIITTLGAGRLMEVMPEGTILILGSAIYLAPAPLLLAWSFWAMLREPMTAWLAPTLLLAFCGGVVPAFGPLLDLGARVNFAAHRPTYDAIVAEAARTRTRGGPDGAVTGERDGVRYRYRAEQPGAIDFPWARNAMFAEGVRYDDSPCVPKRGLRCADHGQPLAGDYSHYRIAF